METLIAQGAEAKLIKISPKILEKNRVKKSYRFQQLDEKIRKQRTKREASILKKAYEIIPVPNLIKVEKHSLQIEYIKGKKLSEHLDSLKNKNKIAETIGKQIALLHDTDIIHGDLTTSNMILSEDNNLYFIDFGLSFISSKSEDKAVDLHLIKQALEAKHHKHFKELFAQVIKGYSISKNAAQVLKRLEKVERRGRYKQQY